MERLCRIVTYELDGRRLLCWYDVESKLSGGCFRSEHECRENALFRGFTPIGPVREKKHVEYLYD